MSAQLFSKFTAVQSFFSLLWRRNRTKLWDPATRRKCARRELRGGVSSLPLARRPLLTAYACRLPLDTLSQQTNGLQAASGASFLWRAVLRPRAPGWVVWTALLVRSVPLTKKDRLLLRRCCQLMLLLQLLRLLQLLPRAAAPVVAAAPPAAPAAVLLQPLSPAAVAVASPPPPRKNLNATLGKTKHDPRETKHGHRKNESRP